MPDDGRRRELIHGVLLVTPAPELGHQRVVLRLARLLEDHAPPGVEVFVAPVDVVPEPTTVLQPDVLVVRAEDATGRHLTGMPLLAVEVLSPSSRHQDLGSKLLAYEEAGVAVYWVFDPEPPGELVVYLLDAGRYREAARVSGATGHDADEPFPLRIVPAQLLHR